MDEPRREERLDDSEAPSAPAVLRYDVPTRDTLGRLLDGTLPGTLRGGAPRRTLYRDLYLDTQADEIEQRGASLRLRIRQDGSQRLALRIRAEHWSADFDAGWFLERILASDCEPTARLRALTDPARLVVRMERAAERTTRSAWLAEDPELRLCLRGDASRFRADAGEAEVFALDVLLPAAAPPPLMSAARLLAGEFGLRSATAPPRRRAMRLLLGRDRAALAARVRAPRIVALIVVREDRVALRHAGAEVRLPSTAGRGERIARRLLRASLGKASARLRLLGVDPGSALRPAVEVWLADAAHTAHEDEGSAGPQEQHLLWLPTDEVLTAAGSPALRDGPTLAALAVFARAELPAVPEGGSGVPAEPAERRRLPAFGPPVDAAFASAGTLGPGTLLNMELSVLAFNRRVLALTEETATPLLERLRFLSIFAANLDEFFRVRVAGFKRQVAAGSGKRTMDGATAHQQLDAISVRARRLIERAYGVLFSELLPALRERGVFILRRDEVEPTDEAWLDDFFRDRVRAMLTPLAVGPGYPFPHIRNLRPALCAVLRHPQRGTEHVVVLELPGGLPRLVPLPGEHRFTPLEDVLRSRLGDLYPALEVVGGWTFRVTRSAELTVPRAGATDLLRAVEEEVRRRPFRPVVRLEVERAMPERVRHLLLRELQFEDAAGAATLGEEDVYTVDWLVDLRALRELADLPLPEAHYPPAPPRNPLDPGRSIFATLDEREVLVTFPEDSFADTVERFVVEAADDPRVASVQLALYRTDKESRIVEALRRASAHGKQVVALVELTARFDEQRNIEWARYLRAAGIHVIYGMPGTKIHAKIALVTRREEAGLRGYAYIGTGNLNATTAALYTDYGLLTADPALVTEIGALFNLLTSHAGEVAFRHLLIAPFNMRERFVEMIDREAEHARAGRGGAIRAKMNGLADREVIAALYRASQAGVRIELIVRGICALRPGVVGLSENIRVLSILGRYLEHGRIFRFENAGEPEYFIGSADWRTRNLSKRVEVITPVRDPAHRARLDEILNTQLASPTAWELGADGTYYPRPEQAPHAPARPAGAQGRPLLLPEPEPTAR